MANAEALWRRWLALDDASPSDAPGYARAVFTSLGVVAAINVVARGQTIFTPLYSPDSYALLDQTPTIILEDRLASGRFGDVVLEAALEALGFPSVRSASAEVAVAILVFVAAAYVFARTMLRDPRPREVFVFAALFTLNPLVSEVFYFSETTLRTALAQLGAAAAVWAAFGAHPGGRARWALAAAAAFVTASVYQLLISYFAVVATFRLAQIAAARDRASQARGFVAGALGLALGLALYLIAVQALRLVWPISGGGSLYSTGSAGLVGRVALLLRCTALALTPPESVAPTLISAVTLVMAGASVFIWARAIARESGAGRASLAALLALAAFAASQSVFAALPDNFPTARLLAPMSLALAGAVTLGWRAADLNLRAGLAVALAVVLFGDVGASASLLFQQRRLNRWEQDEASRAVARLESRPDFAPGMTLAVVGSQWRFAHAGVAPWGSMKVTSLRLWAPAVVEEATGYRFARPNADEAATAARQCAGVKPWPAPDAVAIVDKIAVICLPAESWR